MTNQASTSDTLVLWRQPQSLLTIRTPPFPLDLERSRSRLNSESLNALHTHPLVIRPLAPLPIIQALLLLDGRAYKLLVFGPRLSLGMMASKQGRVVGPLPISAMGSRPPGHFLVCCVGYLMSTEDRSDMPLHTQTLESLLAAQVTYIASLAPILVPELSLLLF